MKKVYETKFKGKTLKIEIGEVAKQADSSVLVRYGDTVVLSCAVVAKKVDLLKEKEDQLMKQHLQQE